MPSPIRNTSIIAGASYSQNPAGDSPNLMPRGQVQSREQNLDIPVRSLPAARRAAQHPDNQHVPRRSAQARVSAASSQFQLNNAAPSINYDSRFSVAAEVMPQRPDQANRSGSDRPAQANPAISSGGSQRSQTDAYWTTATRGATLRDQSQARYVEEDRKLNSSVKLADLLDFSPDLHVRLANASGDKTLSLELAEHVWEELLVNTNLHQTDWDYVPDKPPKPAPHEGQHWQDTMQANMPRLNAKPGVPTVVPLVQETAIVDGSRSPIYIHHNPASARFLHANEMRLGAGIGMIAASRPVWDELPGFFRMLKEFSVVLVVDLTRAVESAGQQRYTPVGAGVICPKGQNHSVECTERANTMVGEFKAPLNTHIVSDGKLDSEFKRLRFDQWPEDGAIDAATLNALADRVDAITKDPQRPILMHCEPGAGRADTLMTLIAARKLIMDEMKANKDKCDPEMIFRHFSETVARGRRDRGPDFLQHKQQFDSIVEALTKQFSQYFKRQAPQNTNLQMTRPQASPRTIVSHRSLPPQGQNGLNNGSNVPTLTRNKRSNSTSSIRSTEKARPSFLERLFRSGNGEKRTDPNLNEAYIQTAGSSSQGSTGSRPMGSDDDLLRYNRTQK